MIQTYPIPASVDTAVRVNLRDPRPSDADVMHEWRSQQAVIEHQPLIYLNTAQIKSDLLKLTSNVLPDYSKDRFQWIIELRKSARPIGWMTLSIRSWEHLIGEIGYSLSQDYHGRGYAGEALGLLLRKVFLEAGLFRIEAKCAVENTASAKLLTKAGFIKEGTLREYYNIRGRRCDHHMFSLLRHEYFGRQPR